MSEPSADAVLEAIATTRAIRRLRPDPVSDADLQKVLFAATRAPSGSNRQPFRFLVLRDGERAAEAKALIGASARRMWADKRAHERYDRGSGEDPASRKARLARTMQAFVDGFEAIPVVVLACLVRYREPRVGEGASVYPACQNFLLAARALGLGGILTQWHEPVEPQLRALLGIPDGVAVHATLTLGHPEGRHGPVRRRPLRELVFEDAWGEAPAWAIDPPSAVLGGGGPPTSATPIR